jgi:hypothetical protein
MNKKTISVIIIIVSCFVIPQHATAKWNFMAKILRNNSDKAIQKLGKEIGSEAAEKGFRKIDPSVLRKSLPDIPLKKLENPYTLKIASMGENIVKKGDFEEKFLNRAVHPEDVLRQYKKYGDEYLDVAKNSAKNISRYLPAIRKLSPTDLKKIGNISPSTIQKFNNSDYANSTFIRIMKRTGKIGYQTTKKILDVIKKYPKSSLVAGLLAWYYTDPEGFLDKVNDVGEYAGKLIGGVATETTKGLGKGVKSSIEKTISETDTSTIIIGAGTLIIFFMLVSSIGRRVIAFPFRMLGNSLSQSMDKQEKKWTHSSANHSDKNFEKQKKSNSNEKTQGLF